MTLDKNVHMSGDQYTKAIEQLGLSRLDAATLLGIDEKTHRRWRDDQRTVPGPVARFLRYLIATGKTGTYAIKKLEG
jgi:DNA-binding transcriptional regulator YiaG